MRFLTVVGCLALSAAACGSPVAMDAPASTPLFSVQGTVTQGLSASAPTAPQEVGVLWLNLTDDNTTVYVEATAADAIGAVLPATFDVSILRPPSDRMLGTALVSYSESGASEQPVGRDRVAFGIVVVAPEGTFANLPTSVSLGDFINPSDASPGALLSSFTYVSPFTVRYVKGAAAEGLTIRDINGVASQLQDFTVFNVDAWARGTETAVCRDRKLGEGWEDPGVKDCIARETAANPDRNSGDIGNECLYAYFETVSDAVDAECGAVDYVRSDFRNALRLDPSDLVTLPLGDGDIRSALTFGGFIFLG